ncbi:4Fe-4S dicluster domain-containing protein [Thermosyntropha lipolytica DSM 11003]|uniref:Ferredoxin n=1 Tax=Thermosyntropha lipolytica DSM 11003 TaxID=1123382 RepID=A0A1M5MQ44_9FIRM|nr:2Fe-2S iron-sulfur cluster-binding protein [Thermosyntropha lipolytica]SHG79009.1 4Fe-4S dicluster domain-containing protein [Thermosyntropha lipolytica DSM 11003]
MKLIIDGREVSAYPGETILEVCRRENIFIPTLCYHPAFKGQGVCRMCMVELEDENGNRRMVASCTYPVQEGLKIVTFSAKIDKVRKNIIRLLASRAKGSDYIQDLAGQYGVEPLDLPGLDNEKCILCRLCVNACKLMGSSVLAAVWRGIDKKISTPYEEAAEECIGCAACYEVCPTGAIEMKEENGQRIIWNKVFNLVLCQHCGKAYATEEQIALVERKTGISLPALCEACRSQNLAGRLKNFSG